MQFYRYFSFLLRQNWYKMKKTSLLAILLLLQFSFLAQEKIPKQILSSVNILGPYLTKGLSSDKEKAEAIYTWITSNISYDYKKIESTKPITYEGSQETLKNKKATCTGYSSLMRDLLRSVDIECEIIHGYSRGALGDSVLTFYADDHAWVAVKLDNDWYLADPTWDAGYVGNIPTNKEEKFKKKWKKLNKKYNKKEKKAKGKEKKVEKVQKKRKKAERKLTKQEYKAKDFTGKQGFVQKPSKRWFLISPDSFLTKHLPSMPMWQLKEDTMGVETFGYGLDSMAKYLEYDRGGYCEFEDNIGEYQELDFLNQTITEAIVANKFNPRNAHIMAQNYHNYISIVTNKKIRFQLPEEHIYYDFQDLLPMVDTVLIYLKVAKANIKESNSFFRSSYKNIKKEDSDIHKLINKDINKLKSLNEKMYDRAEDSWDKLLSQAESMHGKRQKLATSNAKLKDPKEIAATSFLTDSIQALATKIQNELSTWKRATDTTFLQAILDTMLTNQYLLSVKNNYLGYNDYEINDYVREIDSILSANNKLLFNLYNDSLPIEMMDKNMYKWTKELAGLVKNSESELATLESEGKIKSADKIFRIYGNILYEIYNDLIESNITAMSHNAWIKGNLGNFKSYWKDIQSLSKKQDKLIDERYEFVAEELNTNKERTLNMYQQMSDNCKKWKVKFNED